MTPIIKKLAVVGALSMAVSAAAWAQVANQSDIIIAGVSGSPVSGAFTPGTGGRGTGGGGARTVNQGGVANVVAGLNSGTITSPVTGGSISGATVTNLGLLLTGSATGGAFVTSALTGAGIPGGLVNRLVSALNGLGNNPSAGQIMEAARAFNAMVANDGTPNAALNSPEVLAINAVLTAMLGDVSR